MSENHVDSRFSNRTFLNLLTEVAYVLVSALIGLLMVPYYVDELGMAAYAVIPLATSVSTYVMIFADSFCSAINRYFVVSLEGGDMEDANLTYSTSLHAIIRMSVVVLPVMAVISWLSPMIFDITGSSADSVRVLFLLVFWSAVIVAVGSCFNNALIAVNKLFVINAVRISYLVVQVVLILAMFMLKGPSLEYIGFAYLAASLTYLILSYAVMKLDFPVLRFSFRNYSPERVRDIGNLGVWSIVNKISNLMFLQASLVITNICLGTVDEGNFSLVVAMVSMVGTGCLAVANIFYPYYYSHYSHGDEKSLVSTACMGLKFMSVSLAMPLAFICVFSEQIMTIWVGEEYAFLKDVIWVMFIMLTMQSAITVMDVIPTMMLKVRGISLLTLCIGAVNIVLAVLVSTCTDLGLIGVALVYALTMTIRNCMVYPCYNAHLLNVPFRTLLIPQLYGMALFAASALILYAVSSVISVPSSFLVIVILFFTVFLVYSVLTLRYAFNESEKRFLLESMPGPIARYVSRIL